MFSALRQNSLIYVIDREALTMREGTVLSVTPPTTPFVTQPMNMTVDVTASVDGKTMEFKQLPSNLCLADNQQNGIVVGATKEATNQWVEGWRKSRQDEIARMSYNKKALEACDSWQRRLSDSYRKQKEQDDKINALEQSLSDIKQMLADALAKK